MSHRLRTIWTIALVVVALGATLFAARGRIARAIAIARDYETIPYDTGWIALRDGSLVALDKGSRLRALKAPGSSGMRVILAGSARFRAEPPDGSTNIIPREQPLAVQTRNADVLGARADFGVSVRGDTTEVTVYRRQRRGLASYIPLPSHVFVLDRVSVSPVTVNENEVLRVVRGSKGTIVGRSPTMPRHF